MRLAIFLLLLLAAPMPVGNTHAAAETKKFQVGETLPPAKAAGGSRKGYQEIGWSALIPEGWNPAKAFKEINFDRLKDGDPRAMEVLTQMKGIWDAAPVETAWNGQRIRIAGFAVPLERNREWVTEFLLVPYFGACIHTPPPPANQIIHVFLAKPGRKMQTFDTLWVGGVLETTHSRTENEMGIGNAGYRMKAESVEPYAKR